MRSKEHLWNLRSFWVAICVPIALACFVWGAMYRSGLPDLCWSPDCFNYAFELFKVPLAILAFIFPAVALVASHHRSVQTAAQIDRAESQIERSDKQIEISNSKNNFDNYYKHQEVFGNYLNKISVNSLYKLQLKDASKLYRDIFIENSSELFDSKADYQNVLDISVGEIESINDTLKSDKYDKADNDLYIFEICCVMNKLQISEICIKGEIIDIEDQISTSFENIGINISPLYLKLSLLDFIEKLITFSSNNKEISSEIGSIKGVSQAYRDYQKICQASLVS